MKFLRCHFVSALFAVAAPGTLMAQIPNTLLHAIPPPPVGVQSGAYLGNSVAVDGAYAVAGAHADDTGAENSGVVKVFDSATGTLLFMLPNPTPAAHDDFGRSVAISGTLVVIGAPNDKEGVLTAGRAYVYDLASRTPTVPAMVLSHPDPVHLGPTVSFFGWSVAISGTRVAVGAWGDDTGASSAGSAFVYDLASAAPTVPVAVLRMPTPANQAHFGRSVAISGNRVAVGAPGESTGANSAGSAYVYDMASATPAVPVATLHNPNPAANADFFAFSVAISETRVAVGAYRDDTGATDAGSAYVYDLSSLQPEVPVFTLVNPFPALQDFFGRSVALSGTRLAVGAFGDGAGATHAGSVYLYELSGAFANYPIKSLANPGPAADDYFGWSVALSGPLLIVGAFGDDTGATDAGSAYIYDENSLISRLGSMPVASLPTHGPGAGDLMGFPLAVSGSLLVAGCRGDNTAGFRVGSAEVYEISGNSPRVRLQNPSPSILDSYGSAVAISGNKVVVGILQEFTGDPGEAYVYDLASPVPEVPVLTLPNPEPEAEDLFGGSMAISGNLLVVGAKDDDAGAPNAGSAYVYDLSSATPAVPVATLHNPEPAERDSFGFSVAISGTLVAVGALDDDTAGAEDTGSVYVYDMSSANPGVPVARLNHPDASAEDGFGSAVAVSGTRVVVTATADISEDEFGAITFGTVHVFELGGGPPALVATFRNPRRATGDGYGWSVAVSGNRIVVGAIGDFTRDHGGGIAYLYDLSSKTPATPVATLPNPGPALRDAFGVSVAIEGNIIAIGACCDDTVALDKGAAYIYGPHPLDQDSDGLRDAWELTHWAATAGHSPQEDADHDGYNELLELALGMDPTIPDPGGLPPVTNEDGFLTMTITKQSGVTYEVQSAGTLLPALPESFSPASTTVLIDDATTLKVRDNSRIGTPPSRFLRIKVTAVP